MGSGARRESTTQDSGPPEFQANALQELFTRAREESYRPRNYYEGQQIAQFDPAEVSGQNRLLDYAGGGAQRTADLAGQGLEFALTDVLNPQDNPSIVGMGDLITDRFTKRFTEGINPAIAGEAGAAGQVGSSRQGLAQGVAAGRTAEAGADALTQFYSNAYSRGLDTFDRGLAGAGGTLALGAQPAALESLVGSQRRERDQAGLDIEQEKFYFEQGAEGDALQRLLSLIGGSYGGEGTSTLRRPPTIWNTIFG